MKQLQSGYPEIRTYTELGNRGTRKDILAFQELHGNNLDVAIIDRPDRVTIMIVRAFTENTKPGEGEIILSLNQPTVPYRQATLSVFERPSRNEEEVQQIVRSVVEVCKLDFNLDPEPSLDNQ